MDANWIVIISFTAFGVWWVADEWEIWLPIVGVILLCFGLVWMGGN